MNGTAAFWRLRWVALGLLCVSATLPAQAFLVRLPAIAIAVTSAAAADPRIAQAQVLLEDNPQAALDLLEPVWAAAEPPRAPELGLVMVETLSALEAWARVIEIADELADPASLPLASRGLLLRMRWEAANSLRRFEGLETAEQKTKALQAEGLDDESVAALWLNLGNSRLLHGEPAKAEASYRLGLRALGEPVLEIRLMLTQNLAVSLAQQARLPEAIEAFSVAERLLLDLGKPLTVGFLSNFGSMYIEAKDWERGSDYLQKAVAASATEAIGPLVQMRLQSSLGVAQNGMGNLAAATGHFEEALRISRANQLPLGDRLNNLAFTIRESGRTREALDLFEQSLAANLAENNPAGAAVAQKNLGETWVLLGDRAKATDYFERAYRGYQAADVRNRRLELYPAMISNLEAQGRDGEALRLLHEFKALSDETINVESKERVAKLQSVIDLAKSEHALALSEGERVQQEASLLALRAEQDRQRLVAFAMLGGLLALVLIALLLYRQVRFKTHANRQLQDKNTQIEAQHARLSELNETIRLQSLRDSLTGLPNRRFLEEHMAELARSQPISPESPAARGLLLMIDIDHFKRINDTLGHLGGDRALIEVANALKTCLGPNDVVVRWGGEEFLWLAHGAGLEAAPALCKRVQAALRGQSYDHQGQGVPITVSMGFAPRPLWPIDGDDWTLSLRVADDALYVAKSTGRNRWVGYVPGASPPQLPLEQGVLASALEARGHLVRMEQAAGEAAVNG
ncbi:MAG: diguanylate cyclase domain-containing protein [Pseudomarimonas sp.]